MFSLPHTVRNAFGGAPEMRRGGGQVERRASAALGALRRLLTRLVGAIQVTVRSAARQLHAVAPDRWFLVGFVILLLVFFILLLVQPSSVGRGGR